jgi:hypothetical protein
MFVAHSNLPIFRRRLFDFLTMLSLVLCLATVALWVRSYWQGQALARLAQRSGSSRLVTMRSVTGELSLFYQQFPGAIQDSGWSYQVNSLDKVTTYAHLVREYRMQCAMFLGFGYSCYYNSSIDVYAIWFPHWFLALILAVLPALRLRNIRRTRRRNRVGLCQRCGYDLRASPDRCPECGHVPNAAAVS